MDTLFNIIIGWVLCLIYKKVDDKHQLTDKAIAGSKAFVGTCAETVSRKKATPETPETVVSEVVEPSTVTQPA
jgi:hypothetical protein